jgi:hypothetical protein
VSLRDWGPGRLVAAWVGYWALLLVVEAFPAVVEFLRLQLTHAHGSVSHSFSFDAGLGTILLLFGPPLVLWLLWLRARPRGEPELTQHDR